MRKNVIAILALFLLAGWGLYDYSKKDSHQVGTAKQQRTLEDTEIGIKKGNIAPDFELLSLDGEAVKLSDFAGKKVILNFWATWCPPCRAEMPHMEKFYEKYGKGAVVLAVNLTHTEKKQSNVSTFVEDFELSFPIVMDEEGDVTGMYQVFAYPTSYMIDSQGIIQEIYRGAMDYATMKQMTSKMN